MKNFLLLLVVILCVSAKKDKNKCGRRNGGCDQDCDPKTGSCSCDKGYRLSSNGKSCTHKNVLECKKAAGGSINMLDLHNCLRAKHEDTKPLKWDTALSKSAAYWAKFCAENDVFIHQKGLGDKGESLDRITSETPFKNPINAAIEKVLHWYSEIKKFNFKRKEVIGMPGRDHFTQMIWKSTRKVGCGYGVSKDGKTVVLNCHYYPTGNVFGEYDKNIGNPKK